VSAKGRRPALSERLCKRISGHDEDMDIANARGARFRVNTFQRSDGAA